MPPHLLTLAHSPDPDDAFMWWPITGMVDPQGGLLRGAGNAGSPAIDTGRFAFRAVPCDIETLNRRAVEAGDLDITAISVSTYPHVQGRYVLTGAGASMGDGYGPKVVVKDPGVTLARLTAPDVLIAVPGVRTTAFLVLSLILGRDAFRYVEMPFDRIIGAVAAGEAHAGLIIHEGQLTYADAGLRLIVDVGAWWGNETSLPLPLGANVVRRDLDKRFGPGAGAEVAGILRRSVEHAMAYRAESLAYAMSFARANAGPPPTPERVDRFVAMYVNAMTVDMGEAGRGAIRQLLQAGFEAGLCPDPGQVDVVRG